MEKFKGTKGKWKIGKTNGVVVSDNIKQATENDERTGHSESEYYGGLLICESIRSEYDAKLIASAPELLKALKEMVRMYEIVEPAGGWQLVYDMSKSAIKSATE